jgi:hypothetical protein
MLLSVRTVSVLCRIHEFIHRSSVTDEFFWKLTAEDKTGLCTHARDRYCRLCSTGDDSLPVFDTRGGTVVRQQEHKSGAQ